MRIRSKFDLITYLKRYLSDGYTQIVDIPIESYDDAIDDAIQTFFNRVYGSTKDVFLEIPIDKNPIYLPEDVIYVNDIISDQNGSFGDMFVVAKDYVWDNFSGNLSYRTLDVVDYMLFNQNINNIRMMEDPPYIWNYDSNYRHLTLYKIPRGTEKICVRCSVTPNDSELGDAYNHEWLKKRAMANVLKRWYLAYVKSEANLMDGNIKISKSDIKDEYINALNETEQELDDLYCGYGSSIFYKG